MLRSGEGRSYPRSRLRVNRQVQVGGAVRAEALRPACVTYPAPFCDAAAAFDLLAPARACRATAEEKGAAERERADVAGAAAASARRERRSDRSRLAGERCRGEASEWESPSLLLLPTVASLVQLARGARRKSREAALAV